MGCILGSTESSLTIFPSIHFRTIPRPLWVPSSSIPPEYVQVSCTAGGDLDMTLCVFPPATKLPPTEPQYASRVRSLCRMNKLGVYFGTEKREALLRGDTSNAVVDRYFVYSFQTIGMHLCGTLDDSPVMVQLLARYAQKAWETLIEIHKTGDDKLVAQGLLFFVHSLIIMGFPANAQFYLSKVCKVIDKGNLRFLPVYGRPAELSDQFREDAAVLSQAIYLENYLYLTLGGSVPVMTARIEREFRLDLQVSVIR